MVIRNAGIHQAKRGEDFPFHRDNFWELMYVCEGHLICQQESTPYALHAGMMILHPPRVLHADFAVGSYKTYYIWLDLPEARVAETEARVGYDDEARQLDRICGEIVREWNHRYKNQNDGVDRLLFLLTEQLKIVIERCAQQRDLPSGEQLLLAAERIMEAEYHQPLTIADIAHRLHVSESGLYSYFARLRGQTPMAVLQAIRLRHALGHLHYSTRTLDTIASLCGYCSASHLTKHVKAATGKTPGKVRARHDADETESRA